MSFSNRVRRAALTSPGGDAAGMTPVTLQIGRRSGIYRVTCDGVFHGDYTRELWADESAEAIASKFRKEGRRVYIANDDAAHVGDEDIPTKSG